MRWSDWSARVRGIAADLHGLDVAAYRRVAATHSPALDRLLPRLSDSANGGKLWMAAAAALSLSGKKGRAAALRGLASLAATSAIVNGPVKFAVRRRRPEWSIVPVARLLRRQPLTWSFPSGHSASAAAFATGVAMEWPEAGLAAALLAAAVGYSRVHAGVHYPGDVLAGAAIGAVVASVLPMPERHAAVVPSPKLRTGKPAGRGSGLAIAVNAESGSGLQKDPTAPIRDAFPDATIAAGDDVSASIGEAAASAKVALGVSGGDGTVRAAAEKAAERGVPLAVFPGGTLNHFARDIAVDTVDDAVRSLQDGTVTDVDLGRIAGRIFLNTASFGAYPRLVDIRESLEKRIGKWPAALVALLRVVAEEPPARVRIDGRERSIWAIFIGNSAYEPRGFAPSARRSIDDGLLDVRMLVAERPAARLRAAAAALAGRLDRSVVYEEMRVASLRIESLDGPLRLSCDGESFEGPADVEVSKLPRALTVYAGDPEASAGRKSKRAGP